MKSYTYYLITIISLLALTSCKFTEEITFHENGSGTFHYKTDMSAMLEIAKGMEKDSINTRKSKKEKIDTILYVSDFLDAHIDSLYNLSDKERLFMESLRPYKIHTMMDEEAGMGYMDIILDFNNASELNNIKERLDKISTLNNNTVGKTFDKGVIDNDVSYLFTGRKFHRKVTMRKLTPEQQEINESQKEQFDKYFAGSPYEIIYHFPRKIKHVSYPGAEISEDGKTLIIRTVLDSIALHPEKFDFTVKLYRH
jgi:hypothetical protein